MGEMGHTKQPRSDTRWLNRTVLGIGLASLFSDWSHEIATTVMPAFLASMGAAAAWPGLIEGLSDGLSSFAKMASGYFTVRLARRKKVAVLGYLVPILGTGSILAASAWQILIARSLAWFGRGLWAPVRNALLAASVTRNRFAGAKVVELIDQSLRLDVRLADFHFRRLLVHPYHVPGVVRWRHTFSFSQARTVARQQAA